MNRHALFTVLDATWPPAASHKAGPWTIRDGQGGGKRVSAASAAGAWTPDDIPQAEAALAALGQPPLFMIRDSDAELDAALSARGYSFTDPVVAFAAPVTGFPAPARMTAFPHWPPLRIAADLWAEAGIGPARLAVMHRVTAPKTVILGRTADRASGAAFVAVHLETAMLHALEVTPALRRQGSANNMLRAAAHWAQDHGATQLSLVVTFANEGARHLCASHGMQVVGQYHYWQK